MLPFALNCKTMPNRNGNLPWQLAQNPQIVQRLLTPAQTPQATTSKDAKVAANFLMIAEKKQSDSAGLLQPSTKSELDKSNTPSTF